ncbi:MULTISPECIES: DUF417 family protein [Pseudoalteromonas]|uniref:DUF417 domain-containing protein n=1 Tax=Pseudoalteromonas amylolytica TaxID=1859457 RepID=A0A1S1MYZ7_9GAMM|nr:MULTISPECIES: DUF417 family protein [Pseudoalteromonas]OHU90201.1 hypothetical protein BFC16_04435 [Pseudoalteromonas sp. JW3]OHU92432.1 hypothetical protein BET10_05785 [Pseudoalteromonas amylolytica]
MLDKYENCAIKACLALSLLFLGVSFMLDGNTKGMTILLDFYHLESMLSPQAMGLITGGVLVVTAVMVALAREAKSNLITAGALLFIAVVALLTLLSPSRYLQDLGGFPILGSGQGIIKYAALIPLVLSIYLYKRFSLKQLAWLNYLSVAMVLYWIGGLKFFEFEAKGIVSLVSTSPFMSWLYDVFSVQQASNIIGVFDVFFASLLGLGLWLKRPNILWAGILGCGSVFVMTQTFLLSAQGAFSAQTVLGGLGQFVIKDLWFIANLLVIICYTKQLANAH